MRQSQRRHTADRSGTRRFLRGRAAGSAVPAIAILCALALAALCALALVPASASAADPDAFEPDNSYGAATPIVVGAAAQQHTIHVEEDEDWVSFAVAAGKTYTVDTLEGTPPEAVNIALALYSSDGTTKLDYGNGYYYDESSWPDGSMSIAFTADADETISAQVQGAYGGTGTYALMVTLSSDAFEPDDSYGAATPIAVNGAAQQHTTYPDDDQDSVSFAVEPGYKYTVQTAEGTPPDSQTELELRLYDADGTTEIAAGDSWDYYPSIEYTAAAGRTVYAQVLGRGTYAISVTATPVAIISVAESVDFGAVTVGTAPRRILTVTNSGAAVLTVSDAQITGDGFSIVRNEAGAIPAGESREIEVQFSPTVGYAGPPSAVKHVWTTQLVQYNYSDGFLVSYYLFSGFQNTGGAGDLGWRVRSGATEHSGTGAVVPGGRYTVRVVAYPGSADGPVELLQPVSHEWGFTNSLGGLGSAAYLRVADGYLAIQSDDPDDPTLGVDLYGTGVPAPGITSSISITSVSQTLTKYGDAYTLRGRLRADGSALPGRTLRLQSAAGSAGPWTDTVVSATTAADGSFALKHTPRSKTYYRARFAGAGDYAACTSGFRYALPRAFVGTPIAPLTMYLNKAKAVSGYLKPRHPAGTYPVRIYKQRYVSGTWKSYGSVTGKAANYNSYTKYTASVKLAYRGRWRLYATHPADAGHALSRSTGFDYVTVK